MVGNILIWHPLSARSRPLHLRPISWYLPLGISGSLIWSQFIQKYTKASLCKYYKEILGLGWGLRPCLFCIFRGKGQDLGKCLYNNWTLLNVWLVFSCNVVPHVKMSFGLIKWSLFFPSNYIYPTKIICYFSWVIGI